MSDLNVVVMAGRLTRDVETQITKNGKQVANFSIANNDRNKKASFFNCACFGVSAKYLGTYGKKGDLIEIQGSLAQNSYTKQNGDKVDTVQINCMSVSIIKPKNGNNQYSTNQSSYQNDYSTSDYGGSNYGKSEYESESSSGDYSGESDYSSLDISSDDLPF